MPSPIIPIGAKVLSDGSWELPIGTGPMPEHEVTYHIPIGDGSYDTDACPCPGEWHYESDEEGYPVPTPEPDPQVTWTLWNDGGEMLVTWACAGCGVEFGWLIGQDTEWNHL